MPFLDPLKFHKTPYLYTIVSQGYIVLLMEMLIVSMLESKIAPLVMGYMVGNFLARLAPIALPPSPAMVGAIQSELIQWTEEPRAQNLFLRMLTHNQSNFVIDKYEYEALKNAGGKGG